MTIVDNCGDLVLQIEQNEIEIPRKGSHLFLYVCAVE
jgi:hypothetical protein